MTSGRSNETCSGRVLEDHATWSERAFFENLHRPRKKGAECELHCQAPLSGEDPKPWRHQVIELPPIKPVVTEYPWHQLVCAACGEVTRAPWPEGVPSGTYGPRVQATVALYTGS
jgi:transposase